LDALENEREILKSQVLVFYDFSWSCMNRWYVHASIWIIIVMVMCFLLKLLSVLIFKNYFKFCHLFKCNVIIWKFWNEWFLISYCLNWFVLPIQISFVSLWGCVDWCENCNACKDAICVPVTACSKFSPICCLRLSCRVFGWGTRLK
jgi:hypothetical protein